MNQEKYFKMQLIDSAIQGLVEGGMQKEIAKSFYFLLEKMYDSGYNEATREQYINSMHWSRT